MQGRREDMTTLQNTPSCKKKTLLGKSELEEDFEIFHFTPEFLSRYLITNVIRKSAGWLDFSVRF